METLSDNALMLKVKDGDIDKMGLLYERYHRQLFGFLFHMTRHKELSEDIVQNVFFRMLKYCKGFTGSGEFKTWMYHVVRNALHDHFRKDKQTASNKSLDDVKELIAGEQFADEQLEKQQELKILWKYGLIRFVSSGIFRPGPGLHLEFYWLQPDCLPGIFYISPVNQRFRMTNKLFYSLHRFQI